MLTRAVVQLGLVLTAFVSVPFSAMAQSVEQQQTQCSNTKAKFPTDTRIKSCTELINAGLDTPQITAIVYLNRGNAYYDKKDYTRAVEDYGSAARMDPTLAMAHEYQADSYWALGDFARAALAYGEAIRFNTQDPELYASRGDAHFELGQFAKAITDFSKAIRIDPQEESYVHRRAMSHVLNGDLDLAIADFSRVIHLTPDDPGAFNDRGLAYNALGDYVRAISDLDRAVELAPTSATALNNRGLALSNIGDLAKARADLDLAITYDPQNAHARNNRGNLFRNLGEHSSALADYDEAIRIDPNYASPYAGRCFTLAIMRQRLQQAIADCNTSIELADSALTFDYRAFAHYRSGAFQAALSDYTAALRRNKDLTRTLYMRGITRLRLGQLGGGQLDILEANKRDPKIAAEFSKYGVKP